MKAYYQSPVGVLEIEERDSFITNLRIVKEAKDNEINPILDTAIAQLEEYFSGKRKIFELPLKQEGTDFQQKAWKYLETIPYGETVSYKDESIAISTPKAVRAVGSANGKNNIPIIIPCHRVINTGGKLGGYASGLEVKQKLLDLEKKYKNK